MLFRILQNAYIISREMKHTLTKIQIDALLAFKDKVVIKDDD
jgi:hypothetical protein